MTISTPPDGLLIGRLPDDVGVRIVFKSIARLSSAAGAVNNGDDSLFSSFSIVINVISSIKSSIVSSPSSTILVNNVLDGHASLDILDGQLQVVALALRWGSPRIHGPLPSPGDLVSSLVTYARACSWLPV